MGLGESPLEGLVDMAPFQQAYSGKTVLVTGHTGFKGSWLVTWLRRLGARVVGYALAPPTTPAMFDRLLLQSDLEHHLGDIREAGRVRDLVVGLRPDFVFHLAAQPLVRDSYDRPVETYEVNAMGTVYLLEGLRTLDHPCAAVFITTDKCYENREWEFGYRETDPLGGNDPYSSSKAAAEIAIAAYRHSFFRDHPVRIASARAGNVIGGGDWARDRIVPDCIRALEAGRPIQVRNRRSTRPWQHVLESLSGYLWLGALLAQPAGAIPSPATLATAVNFGPPPESHRTVGDLVVEILRHWPGCWVDKSDPQAAPEARFLHLTIDRAAHLLGWTPTWSFATAVAETVAWYRQAHTTSDPAALKAFTEEQITRYETDAVARALPWASAAITTESRLVHEEP